MGLSGGKSNLRIALIKEPDLFFGGNSKCLDPQVGLLNFGPHGGNSSDHNKKISIRTGILGTKRSIDKTKVWLDYLKYRIGAEQKAKTEYKGIDFPGLRTDSPLHFEIVVDNNCCAEIERSFVKGLESHDRKERITLTLKRYCDLFDDLTDAHPPNILLLPIDDDILSLCKEPYQRTDKIVYQRREFGDPSSSLAKIFDFHNYLKAQAALRNFTTQLISPKTLAFSEQRQSPALIAWNFAVALYYKATGIPWKLADIDDKTCFIGVSFYNEISHLGKSVRASIAQVYLRTGESQVLRGEIFDWDEGTGKRNVRLTSEQMEKIIKDSIDHFYRQRLFIPKRVVVHKSTRFSDEEITGCQKACENIDSLDIVHIREFPGFRAYHDQYDYPVVRGTAFLDSKDALLFTSGYVPALATYPGPSVPRPLHLICQKLDTSVESICSDIMGLTKLDWNSSTFYSRMPVTIGVSRKVGEVMAEMVASKGDPPSSYRFFM
jgi:hypothetical protein